jgi:hypothetical protein
VVEVGNATRGGTVWCHAAVRGRAVGSGCRSSRARRARQKGGWPVSFACGHGHRAATVVCCFAFALGACSSLKMIRGG